MVNKINVGEGIAAGDGNWTFGDNTPNKFSKHVNRSVPFYETGHDIICSLSDYFIKTHCPCYEIGVSTAVLLSKLAQKHPSKSFVGIDIEDAMIKQASLELQELPSTLDNIVLTVDDITQYAFEQTDFVISYYTAQFIRPHQRQELFNNIYESLNWGGAFVLFEKVRGPDARFQDILTGLYTDFKLNQGYSADEIIGKSKSLKGVLEPFSTKGNIELMERSGFSDITTIFKYLCFEGFLAIK